MLKKSQIIDFDGFLENNYTLDIVDSDISLEGMIVLKESLGEDNTLGDNIHLRGTAEAWLGDFDIVVVGSSGMVLISKDVNQMYLDYPEVILEEVEKLIKNLKKHLEIAELYSDLGIEPDTITTDTTTDRWWWYSYSTKSPWISSKYLTTTTNTAIDTTTTTIDNLVSNVTNILPGDGVYSS